MLPKSPPIVLIILSIMLISMGIAVSPELLIKLGPMRTSLTSTIELVKLTAEREVIVLRLLALLSGVIVLGIFIFWNKVMRLGLIKHINALDDPNVAYPQPSFISSLVIVGTLWVCVILYYLAWSLFISPELDRYIGLEDGIIENLSALLFFGASAIFLGLTFFASRKQEKLWFGILFFGLLFIAGEEISWGQRIFNIETFDAMKGVNVQNENNLHNLLGYVADHIFIVGVFLLGCLMPLAHYYSDFFRKTIHVFGLSVPSYALAVGFFLASLLHGWLLGVFINYNTSMRPAEIREMLCALAFLLFAVERWRIMALNKATL